jgi:hypothetical protein
LRHSDEAVDGCCGTDDQYHDSGTARRGGANAQQSARNSR